jgi:hypothetical protein
VSADRENFYKSAADRFAASTRLYRVKALVHVEDRDDIWFWEQPLRKYSPGLYKFLPASMNEAGNRTTGCEQCLKYKNYLSQRFFICIDSDLRYLLDEELSVRNGIMQTYTYSWENHCAFASRLQQIYDNHPNKNGNFDFISFLAQYSAIVFKPFLLMLYQERNYLKDFDRDAFKRCISVQYRKGDEQNNGRSFLERLSNDLVTSTRHIHCDFDLKKESQYYETKGVTIDSVYLYVRGHCLYNSLISIGRHLYKGDSSNFEQDIRKSDLTFDQYNEITKIGNDIRSFLCN